jgi:hypothetical protein
MLHLVTDWLTDWVIIGEDSSHQLLKRILCDGHSSGWAVVCVVGVNVIS